MNQYLYILEPDLVKTVEYTGNSEQYDFELRQLAPETGPCVVINPWLEDSRPYYFIEDVDLDHRCQVYTYQGEWIAKFFPAGWDPHQGYDSKEIVIPQIVWRKNPDLDRNMTFENDPFNSYKPDPYESKCELVWYIDPRFNPLDDKVWAMTCRPLGGEILERREMGFLAPCVNVEINSELPEFQLDIDSMMPAFWELDKINAYRLDSKHETDQELWVVKITPAYRVVKDWIWYGTISPKMQVTYNTAIPRMNYSIDTDFPWHEMFYEHVYFLDRIWMRDHEPDMWAVKIKFISEVHGHKNQGYISPEPQLEFNPDLGELEYDLVLDIPRHDLEYEHYYYLDPVHTRDLTDDIWAIRLNYAARPKGQKHMGYYSPIQTLKTNRLLGSLNFNLDQLPVIQYYDFAYRNVMLLKQSDTADEIWAFEITFTERPKGYKKQGFISPLLEIEYNPDITNIRFKPEININFHDRFYQHIWYLESKTVNDLIWVAKASISNRTKGEKIVGYVKPVIPDRLDVFFISYNEPQAELNWQRVLTKAPWAKRIHGIKGIFNAHKEAARLSETDMFYVVDGDAYLVDNWTFDFQPDIFNRKYTHIWSSINPLNDLTYGYGGVKLLPRSYIIRMKKWLTLDFTSNVGAGIKIMDGVSNITKFNTDPFTTWRSAFREGIKLSKQGDQHKIKEWATNKNAEYFSFAVKGLLDATEYYQLNRKDLDKLNLINDMDWLLQEFESRYGARLLTSD